LTPDFVPPPTPVKCAAIAQHRQPKVKFYQLRPNARFLFQTTIYRKVSPLKAVSEADESQRLIARSADVTQLDEAGNAVIEKLPETLPSERLEAALAQFLATCEGATTGIDPALTESQLTQLQRALRVAGRDLLTRLALQR